MVNIYILRFSSLDDHSKRFIVQVIDIHTHTFIQCIYGQHFFHVGHFLVQYLAQGLLQIGKTGIELPASWLEDDRSTPSATLLKRNDAAMSSCDVDFSEQTTTTWAFMLAVWQVRIFYLVQNILHSLEGECKADD